MLDVPSIRVENLLALGTSAIEKPEAEGNFRPDARFERLLEEENLELRNSGNARIQ
jgi:hypothetical protein